MKVIGVHPGEWVERRARLLAGLEDAFPVRFVPGRRVPVHGLLLIGEGEAGATLQGDRARAVGRVGCPALVVPAGGGPPGGGGPPDGRGARVRMSGSLWLEPLLRGRSLCHGGIERVPPLRPRPGDEVLAEGPTGPLWIRRAGSPVTVSALPPAEITPGGRVKEQLRDGRFLGLLPLIQLLRDVTGLRDWQQERVRASLVIDDPNLRRPRYGFLRFRALEDHAAACGYHVGLAMVPADLGRAHAATADLIRRSRHLSLLVHGNDHTRRELAASTRGYRTVLAQAQRRIAAFEAGSTLQVAPVMVPPHSACSAVAMQEMLHFGFEAVLYHGPVPGTPCRAATGLAPADLQIRRAVPGLPRLTFAASTGECALRAYLGQPLVLYGHHTDLADGLDVLERVTGQVGAVGDVQWLPPLELSRTNVLVKRRGEVLQVRPYTRRFRVAVPPAARLRSVEVVADGLFDPSTNILAVVERAGQRLRSLDPPCVVPLDGSRPAQLELCVIPVQRCLEPDDPVLETIGSPRLMPRLRRRAAELRDRALPLTTAARRVRR